MHASKRLVNCTIFLGLPLSRNNPVSLIEPLEPFFFIKTNLAVALSVYIMLSLTLAIFLLMDQSLLSLEYSIESLLTLPLSNIPMLLLGGPLPERFMPRFHTFLEALKECEARKIKTGPCQNHSVYKFLWRSHWRLEFFGFVLLHDKVLCWKRFYWDDIDSKFFFFGFYTTIEDCLCLLSAEETANIVIFVEKKMHQARERSLDSHYSTEELVGL